MELLSDIACRPWRRTRKQSESIEEFPARVSIFIAQSLTHFYGAKVTRAAMETQPGIAPNRYPAILAAAKGVGAGQPSARRHWDRPVMAARSARNVVYLLPEMPAGGSRAP